MRMQFFSGVAAICVAMFAMAGCDGPKDGPAIASQTAGTDAAQAVKALKEEIGMSFPPGTAVISASDGGGRDPSYGFYIWVLFSPNQITMPLTETLGGNGYRNLDLADTVTYAESASVRALEIKGPQSAFGSDWNLNGYEFRGTIIRTSQGDYLVIERFLKR